ncbi:MAG: response regulator transcription factor [Mobiluncus sp.]|uniref:Response regulator transcription factor n=1 Tax=Mobiluncus porci TaxID=2652278 RepID=A0A7K0K6L2_9ACTO|nr:MULTISPECIES: response regulator transcription factor [Mobiluncus]MCI6585111.1 response regulator transcription factor [Mobiluncus sp.]MST50645.1 response regulator transcription factor [Mobiluncus porci]
MTNNEDSVLRVIFADDDPLYLEQESILLRRQSSLDLAGTANSGTALLELAARIEWDVALLDIGMPVLDGIATLQRLLEQRPEAVVLMLTAFERPETLRQALGAGAKGFLTKDTPSGEIAELIHRAYQGKTVLDDRPLDMLRDYYLRGEPEPVDPEFARRLAELPPRLRKVADCLAQSMTNREISRATGLAENTVGSYVRDVITELGARRGEIAVKMGQLELKPENYQ